MDVNSGVAIDMESNAFNSAGHPARRRRIRLRAVACFLSLAACLLAGVAQAAKIVDMRVGRHAEFTRVVFELDAPAGYSLERRTVSKGVSELIVTLDASGGAESVKLEKALIDGVEMSTEGAQSVARVRLSRDGLRVKEMILASPPRIVLDVLAPAKPKVAAAKPPVAESQKTQSAKAESPTAASKPTNVEPQIVAKAEKPAAARPASKPSPKVLEEAEPVVPAPAPRSTQPERKISKAKTVIVGDKPEPQPSPMLAGDPSAKPGAAKPTPSSPVAAVDGSKVIPQAPKSAATTQKIAARPPTPVPSAAPSSPTAVKPAPGAPSPTAVAKAPTTPPPPARAKPAPRPMPAKPAPASIPTPASPSLFTPTNIGGGLALLALVGGAGFVFMRRRAQVEDLDLSEFEDDPLAADNPFAELGDDANPTGGADDMMAFGGGSEVDEFGSGLRDDSPIPKQAAGTAAQDDLFDTTVVGLGDDDDSLTSGEKKETAAAMGDDMDTFGETTAATQGMNPMAMGGAGLGADASQLLQEIQQRMQAMESRIDELSEAKERLERQVAAQTEELRVQRAAIARTQRALRNMNRPEDEAPTEPAIRNPEGP